MHLGGLLSNQEARVARGDSLVRLLRFFRPKQPPACIYNSMTAHCTLTILNSLVCDVKLAAMFRLRNDTRKQ